MKLQSHSERRVLQTVCMNEVCVFVQLCCVLLGVCCFTLGQQNMSRNSKQFSLRWPGVQHVHCWAEVLCNYCKTVSVVENHSSYLVNKNLLLPLVSLPYWFADTVFLIPLQILKAELPQYKQWAKILRNKSCSDAWQENRPHHCGVVLTTTVIFR